MNMIKVIYASVFIILYIRNLGAADITVRIDNPPESGSIALVLFDSANTFGDLRDPYRVFMHQLNVGGEYLIDDV